MSSSAYPNALELPTQSAGDERHSFLLAAIACMVHYKHAVWNVDEIVVAAFPEDPG